MAANDAVVNAGPFLCLLRKFVGGIRVVGGACCWYRPVGEIPPGGVGDDGDILRLLKDEDRESMGLKHCASGLNPRLELCISGSTMSSAASWWLCRSEYRLLISPFSPIR